LKTKEICKLKSFLNGKAASINWKKTGIVVAQTIQAISLFQCYCFFVRETPAE